MKKILKKTRETINLVKKRLPKITFFIQIRVRLGVLEKRVGKRIKKSSLIKKIRVRSKPIQLWFNERPFIIKVGRVGLLIVGLYLVLYPLFPNIVYHLFYKGEEYYPYETRLQEPEAIGSEDEDVEEEIENRKGIPEDNRVVIPKIHVDMPIVEGPNESVLDLGIWHRPGTGTPGIGNMVLTGHRVGYAFLPDDVKASTSFYNLDKLSIGDNVIIYWSGIEYDYAVTGSEIVYPGDMEIESQTVGERLTLYTCHPVGSNARRLVYYAERIQ